MGMTMNIIINITFTIWRNSRTHFFYERLMSHIFVIDQILKDHNRTLGRQSIVSNMKSCPALRLCP